MKNITLVVLCLASMFLSCSSAIYADDVDRSSWKLKTEEDAAALTLAYFSKSDRSVGELKNSAKLVVFAKDNTPFLNDSINNRHGWQVKITTALQIQQYVPLDSADDGVREFTLGFDAETGRLVHMSYILAADYPYKAQPDSADSAQLKSWGKAFHAFPDSLPNFSFLEALNFVVGNPFSAKEIHGWYLMYSRYSEKPHPVWLIFLKGVDPPFESMSHIGKDANIPVERRNYMWSVVDAMTGVHILSKNFPLW